MQGGGGGKRRKPPTSRDVGGGGGGGGDGGGDSCTSLQAKTALQSPDFIVLGMLRVGDELDVRLVGDASSRSLVAVHRKHGEAGTLLPPSLERFVACMGSGNRYKARVTQLDGAHCEVQMHHESR